MRTPFRRFAAPLACAALLAACAQPAPAPSQQLDPELGVQPNVTGEEPTPLASPAVSSPSPATTATADSTASPAVAADDGDSASPIPAPEPSANTAPPPPTTSPAPSDSGSGDALEPIVLLAVSDRAGDHGARGPDWTDLRSLEMVEVGNDLRVTLRFGGDLPATPPEGEVPLAGVNIGDEGYQLFVEGGGQSWAAYLDTPEGFVEYPGTFELAGSAMVLQVPFNAIGSPTRAPVRVFVEWSRDSGVVGVLNPTSEDKLDGEPHTFDRTS